MDRNRNIESIQKEAKAWDLAIIGGGASGLGVALDALSRGLSVVLVEKADFAKGTSSRSTKLLHGGVRYLAQGDVSLVFEALRERGLMMKNAPHVSRKQSFIIPIYSRWDQVKYGAGLKIYDLMAGSARVGASHWLSKNDVVQKIPAIQQKGLLGGVVYYDGQFDDARFALNIAQTCSSLGGCMINYMEVTSLSKDEKGIINGVKLKDTLSQNEYKIKAKAVVNATGVFADEILQMDKPGAKRSIIPSQGAHLVLDLSFLGGQDALMIPETSDGRVLFGIPWHGKLVLGTTDTVMKTARLEPKALEKEIDFILETCASYLVSKPTRKDVLAVYAGLRPLAAPKDGAAETKEISRSHKVSIGESHLISIIGGKWTTYRKMGQDTVEAFAKLKGIQLNASTSEHIKLHGYPEGEPAKGHMAIYGSDASKIKNLMNEQPELAEKLHAVYPYTKAEVVWMARHEMALKIEDVLARRIRILFLDAQAAMEMAPIVAELMRSELQFSEEWKEEELEAFQQLAGKYLINTSIYNQKEYDTK
jgi:glycerol-3-phosphate dehydrogenase